MLPEGRDENLGFIFTHKKRSIRYQLLQDNTVSPVVISLGGLKRSRQQQSGGQELADSNLFFIIDQL